MTNCQVHLPECTLRGLHEALDAERDLDRETETLGAWEAMFDSAYDDGDEFGDYDGELTFADNTGAYFK